MRIHVGTSGYNYPEWRGTFYPEKLPAKRMFEHYAGQFHTVEINATFYRMPTPKNTAAWLEQAPPGFSYTLKAPKQITHIRRLKDCEDAIGFFSEAARGLGAHLAVLLYQLPPTFKCDLVRLEGFLGVLPGDLRAAFEFRHESWLNDDVYDLLERHKATLCIADFGDKTTPLRPTSRCGYFRLRDEGYTPADLERWAVEILSRAPSWDDAFVYFKHEDEGKGPEFAKLFIESLQVHGITVA